MSYPSANDPWKSWPQALRPRANPSLSQRLSAHPSRPQPAATARVRYSGKNVWSELAVAAAPPPRPPQSSPPHHPKQPHSPHLATRQASQPPPSRRRPKHPLPQKKTASKPSSRPKKPEEGVDRLPKTILNLLARTPGFRKAGIRYRNSASNEAGTRGCSDRDVKASMPEREDAARTDDGR